MSAEPIPPPDGSPTETPAAPPAWLARCTTELAPLLAEGVGRRAYERDEEVADLLKLLAAPLARHPVILARGGAGKSAVARETLRRVQRGECPQPLQGLRLVASSPRQLLSGLPPGVGWRSALSTWWEHLQAGGPVLLWWADAHEAVGAGTSESDESDLASMLTGLLAGSSDGKVRVLAEARADRWEHLTRVAASYTGLFMAVPLTELEGERLGAVLRAVCSDLEAEHGVLVEEGAWQRAVELTQRYIVGEALPGKALALIEEALAGQADASLLAPTVGAPQVTERFVRRTGLPLALVDEDALWEEEAVREHFTQRVLGQELAVEAVVQRLSLLKAGIHDTNRPLGVFLFVGPTGVGKTELARALAHFLYGRDERLVRINMADYSEFWQFSQLFGVGDPSEPIEAQRGHLTTRLGAQPFTVLLLDEFEKAFWNIFQRFLQLFDEGVFINGAGEEVNLRNAIIILTSNLAANMAQKGGIGFLPEASETMEQRVIRTAEEYFSPELMNRIDQIVFFHPLSRATLRRIAFRELERLFQREGIQRRHIEIEVDDSAVDWVVAQGYSERFGARYLRRQMEKSISYPIARAIIGQRVAPGSLLRLYRRGSDPGQIEATVVPPQEASSLQGQLLTREPTGAVLALEEVRAALPALRDRVVRAAEVHHVEPLRQQRDELLAAMARPDFWEAGATTDRHLQRLAALSARVELVDNLMRALQEAEHLLETVWGKSDFASLASLRRLHGLLNRDLARAELDLAFRDPYDPQDAWLTVTAGGDEAGAAAAWVSEVVRMYVAWAARRGFEGTVVDEVMGGGRDPLQVRLRVVGHGAFALLRGESGLHRLVEAATDGGRAIRHARVAVWPFVEEEVLPMPLSDLRLHGESLNERGSFLKRLRSRVTVMHRPDGRQIVCQSEGSLHETERLALALLRAALVTEREGLTPPAGTPPWHDVVRTYQRHREQGVRDHRTDLMTGSLQHVLGGRLDPFLMAVLAGRSAAPADE